MRDSLYNKTVWITGATSGIGEALALACASAGARVVLSARRPAELERVAQACLDRGTHTPVIVPLDMTRPQDFARTVVRVQELCGRIDVLINNAGIGQRALAIDTLPSVERAIMDVNYFGPILLTKAVLPVFRAQKSGTVVVVGSVMAYIGTPMRAAYAASKHALNGWFDSLREEIRADGLRVLIVSPGLIRTQISRNALRADGTMHAQMDAAQKKGLPPERVAEATIRAIRSHKEEIFIGGSELWAVRLKRWAPRLFSRMLAWSVRRGVFPMPKVETPDADRQPVR